MFFRLGEEAVAPLSVTEQTGCCASARVSDPPRREDNTEEENINLKGVKFELMGGGNGMTELSLMAALFSSSVAATKESIPHSLLQALRVLDQERGEDTEREALHGVIDSLVEWLLQESKTPRADDGEFFYGVKFGGMLLGLALVLLSGEAPSYKV